MAKTTTHEPAIAKIDFEDENRPMSGVERTLRAQRDVWRDVVARTSQYGARDLPREAPKRIFLFGTGSSHHAAKLCGYALLRDKTRVRIPVISCSSQQMGREFFPTRGDWAFGFSHRGRTDSTLKALEMCRREGAFTVLVAGKGVDLASSFQDLILHTCPQESVEPHTVAVTSAICAVTTLLLPARAAEEWDALTSVGEPSLELMCRRAGLGPEAIIGEWEGQWLAKEGALKLMEMAKLPVRSFGSEEYFHGPRYSVTGGVWHVRMPEDTRMEDITKIKPAHTIDIYGGSPLAWVPALIELQWLALAVALNRGVNPDLPEAEGFFRG
jgi:fructoselysine-6-P-deglycase FrlB-like protein